MERSEDDHEASPAWQRGRSWIRPGFAAATLACGALATRELATAHTGTGQQALHLGVAILVTLAVGACGLLVRIADRARRDATYLFHRAAEGLVEVDAECKVIRANAAACRVLGRERQSLVGLPLPQVLAHPGGGTGPEPVRPRQGGVFVVELEHPSGERRQLELGLDAGPQVRRRRRFITVRDVTHRTHLETRRAHAQRLESLGELVSHVAHQFGNVLEVVGANASVVATSDDPEIRASACDIQEAERWGRSLTRQLLAYSRLEGRRPEHLDLVEVVRGVARLMDRLVGRTHRLTIAAGEPVPVFADQRQVEQLAVNLLTNARDAMPGGGAIAIRVLRMARDMARDLGSELVDPDQAMLEVEDRGVGMSPETRERIFQPFFTTKPAGLGTGLGLSSVREIAAQAGGSVAVDSVPDHGSRFRLFLPVVEAARGAEPAGEQGHLGVPGSCSSHR